MVELARKDDATLIVLSLSVVELRSAVERRIRSGDIQPAAAQVILRSFRQHVESLFVTQAASEDLLKFACDLVGVHGLRAYDAVQLAGCLVQQTRPVFVCS